MKVARLTGLVLVLVALLGQGMAQAAPAAPPAPAAPQPTTPIPFTADRFTADVGAAVTPAKAQELRQAGVQMVRYTLLWSTVQPSQASAYDWSVPDSDLATLSNAGLDVLVTVAGNPLWASTYQYGVGPVDRVPESVYFNWISAVATRYSSAPYQVRAWEILNEEDTANTWGNRVADYIRYLSNDYTLLKAANPDIAVIMGGMAYDNFQDQCNGCPYVRNFLPNFLAAGGAAYTDAINFHHYSNGVWGAQYGEASLRTAVADIRAKLAAAGVNRPLVWTEGSISSNPTYGGSDAIQTAYVAKSYARTYGLGLDLLSWFPSQDFPSNDIYAYFSNHGLLDVNGTTKPSYTAYSVATGIFSGTTFLHTLLPGELGGSSTAEGYSFLRPGNTGLLVVWNNAGGTTQWPASYVQGVTNVMGQAVSYTVSNGQAVVPLSSSPVYVRLSSPLRFSDVPLDAWNYTYVEYLTRQGAVGGYSDGTYRPGNNATRGQISKMIVAAATIADTIPADRQSFADVPTSNTFWLPIERMAGRGIIGGYACGGSNPVTNQAEPCDDLSRPYFRPGNNVTRAQLSKMLTLTKGWTPVSGQQSFADVPASSSLNPYVEAVYAHGVVGGYACGTRSSEPCDALKHPYFRPADNATRAQLAKMIYLAVTQP